MQKIFHIVIDDKFIDMGLRQFEEVAPGLNYPVILGRKRALQYVRNEALNFLSVDDAARSLGSSECAAVVFHSLPDAHLPLLRSVPEGKPVFWLGWGYDYYARLLAKAYPEGLLLPQTRSLLTQLPSSGVFSKLNRISRAIARRVLGKTARFTPEMLSRIDYFCPVLDTEYRMVRELNPGFAPQYLGWNYGTVEDDLAVKSESRLGLDILVGNSATPENNHLEIFDLLRGRGDLQGRRIIVPLSYGDAAYREKIIAAGHEYFGDRFQPLMAFMPNTQYIDLLNSCGYVIFNHLRQQAMGNTLIMMMKGARVFMHSQSPAYRWLTDKGAVIDETDSLSGMHPRELEPLDPEARRVNAEFVGSHWGREAQKEKTRKLIEVALGRSGRMTG